ncbi:MAG TPA: LCP family protein [Streptosporangiaceae bacterium]|nr:LCP family protein [Streptosporangiaceae bacterium]
MGLPAGASPASGTPGSRSRSVWPDQPPPSSSRRGRGTSAPLRPGDYEPGQASPGLPGSGFGGRGRGWRRPRRIFGILALIVALALVAGVAEYFNLNSRLHKKNVLVDYSSRPAQGDGTNWLIAGSDSRQGLTRKQERRFSTGHDIGGHRSDTILILHTGGPGKPLLISLPRDSWVNIPGYGFNKINAAYDFGGPKLLAKTVQNATGLRIDHYMEIGFGGFVNVVNAVGGVHMCIKYPLHDTASGLNVRKGCQTLSGGKALAYVRDRHTFAMQDLQRVQNQRLLIKALLEKVTSPGVMLNPFKIIPAADGATATLTVDSDTSLLNLAGVAFALKHPQTTTVPIGNAGFVTSTGQDAVEWDRTKALQLFNALNDGRPVPHDLITGSKQAS